MNADTTCLNRERRPLAMESGHRLHPTETLAGTQNSESDGAVACTPICLVLAAAHVLGADVCAPATFAQCLRGGACLWATVDRARAVDTQVRRLVTRVSEVEAERVVAGDAALVEQLMTGTDDVDYLRRFNATATAWCREHAPRIVGALAGVRPPPEQQSYFQEVEETLHMARKMRLLDAAVDGQWPTPGTQFMPSAAGARLCKRLHLVRIIETLCDGRTQFGGALEHMERFLHDPAFVVNQAVIDEHIEQYTHAALHSLLCLEPWKLLDIVDKATVHLREGVMDMSMAVYGALSPPVPDDMVRMILALSEVRRYDLSVTLFAMYTQLQRYDVGATDDGKLPWEHDLAAVDGSRVDGRCRVYPIAIGTEHPLIPPLAPDEMVAVLDSAARQRRQRAAMLMTCNDHTTVMLCANDTFTLLDTLDRTGESRTPVYRASGAADAATMLRHHMHETGIGNEASQATGTVHFITNQASLCRSAAWSPLRVASPPPLAGVCWSCARSAA